MNHSGKIDQVKEQMTADFKDENGQYPTRSEIHRSRRRAKETKKKVKLKYPLISLLALCFILLPILFLTLTYYYEKDGTTLDNGQKLKDYESIIIDNNRSKSQAPENSEPADASEESSSGKDADLSEDAAVASKPEEKAEKPANSAAPPQEKKPENEPVPSEASKTASAENVKKSEPAAPPAEDKPAGKVVEHVVKPKENLYRISLKYYKSREGEAIIKDYNQIAANEVYAGQVLEIPLKQ
ncbi:LysM peptidoglycan-binding domain-containing protein [Metabacillus sp. KIGAM252]|uniref:LysM peptidoglycan-binding domain-containing protein n=1 Tax=Metabacillus flavus TaxID=2823519 RepID=A0ABS5LFE5_9BACI|nr:LysM peptidoglycan-binding domain-containing protein [Metabacillus flavus]MBS2969444.1 LysM peptidoglycan-binding domain-containing protein [Metabacillus flavus]